MKACYTLTERLLTIQDMEPLQILPCEDLVAILENGRHSL